MAFLSVLGEYAVLLTFIPVAVATASVNMMLLSIDRLGMPNTVNYGAPVSYIGLFFLFGVISAVGISTSNVMKDKLNVLLSRLMAFCAISFILMACGKILDMPPLVAAGMVSSGVATLPMPGIALKLAVSITQTDDLSLEGTVAGYLDLMACLFSSALFLATDAPLAKYPAAQMIAYAALISVMMVLTTFVPDKDENRSLKTRQGAADGQD